jgi:hypothetical protein
LGLEKTFNSPAVLDEFKQMMDSFKRTEVEGNYYENDTGYRNTAQYELDDFVNLLDTAKRADGTYDIKELQKIIDEVDAGAWNDVQFGSALDEIRNMAEQVQLNIDYAKEKAIESLGGGVNQGIISALNNLGREAGAPGIFDRLLSGEARQTPDAIAESQKLMGAVASIATRADTTRTAMQPDMLTAASTAAGRQALQDALKALPPSQRNNPTVIEIQRLAGMLSPAFIERQANRVNNGMAQLAILHRQVGSALSRGTNAGISDALTQTADVQKGIRTTIDTMMHGSRQQLQMLAKLRDLATTAASPTCPEPLRQAILKTIQSVPYRQQEKASRAAIVTVARIGKSGALPTLLAVAGKRNLPNAKEIADMAIETQSAVNSARKAVTSWGRNSYANDIDALIRPIQRASAVYNAGRP